MTSRIDELLDEVAAYADRLADSDRLADTGSMTTAEALAELYEKREWIEEWNAKNPIKERKGRGRPADPEGRNRFSQWLKWKLEEERERRALTGRHTYRLLNAHEISRFLGPVGQINSERTIRPLDWLRKNGYLERAPEVWKRAVELAGGSEESVTGAVVERARNAWKKDTFGGIGTTAKTPKAITYRTKAKSDVEQLFATGDEEQVKQFHDWYVNFFRQHLQATEQEAA